MSLIATRRALWAGVAGGGAFSGAYDDTQNIVLGLSSRLLDGDYGGGYLYTIRRDSDDDEADFGHDNDGDLRTDLIADFLNGANGYIRRWYEQYNGYHAEQTDTTKQPLYVASGQNGKPTIRFDGVDDFLVTTFFHPTANQSMLVVWNASGNDQSPAGAHDGSDRRFYFETQVDQYRWAAGDSNSFARGTRTTETVLHVLTAADGSASLYQNADQISNALSYTWGSGDASTDPFHIGSRTFNGSDVQHIEGDIAELIVTNAAWVDTERNIAETIANDYWAVETLEFSVTSANVDSTRSSIIAEVWSGNGYPTAGVDATSSDVTDPLNTSASNLLRVDELTINMDDNDGTFVMDNMPHVWYPTVATANGKLAIMHYGHSADPDNNWNHPSGYAEAINALIEDGYTVAGIQMSGDTSEHNSYPDATATLNYLKFFVEPVARVINELESGFSAVYMTGKSGGGWTTHLVTAIDERIERSVPVAGALPLNIAIGNRDWEQQLPSIDHLVDYHDLFAMACTSSRTQVQLLNEDDSCCFTLAQYNSAMDPYADDVEAKAIELGGTYSLVWDDTHSEHIISAYGRSVILDTFNG